MGFVRICVPVAFHDLGLPAKIQASGPFEIIAGRDSMLKSLGHCVQRCSRDAIVQEGKYIVYQNDHCFALRTNGLATVSFEEGDGQIINKGEIADIVNNEDKTP